LWSIATAAVLAAECAMGAGGPDPAPPGDKGGGLSPAFTVSGAVNKPATFDLTALQKLPATQQTFNGSVYTGVSLWTLLESGTGGIRPASGKNPTIMMYAVATGSDGYRAVLSMAEIDPGLSSKPAFVAYSADGKPLERNGMARLVVPGDAKASRSVANLAGIEVFELPPSR
jgi:DMSO/TMAO reductase YedYZ molybdopterin-dependent catalytic subunit